MRMFEFIGALFGMSIRSGMVISLDFPPLFWKWLADDRFDSDQIKDLEMIDVKCLQNLDNYKQSRS